MSISTRQVARELKAAKFPRPGHSPALQAPSRRERSAVMEIEGTVRANVLAAVASARRLRNRPVHQDTLRFWGQLIDHARREASRVERDCLSELIAELESQLAQRGA